MKTTTGERIKMLRKRKGWTQDELAKRMGVSRVTIGSWETGKVIPKIESVQEMAVALGSTPAYINLGDETPAPMVEKHEHKTVVIAASPAKRVSGSDRRKLEDIELLMKHLPDLRVSKDEQKAIYLTVSEIWNDLNMRVLFGE
jgi:transcriptional regulator with XRE-family HTH domain